MKTLSMVFCCILIFLTSESLLSNYYPVPFEKDVWQAYSSDGEETEMVDTVFNGKECIVLNGKEQSLILNKTLYLKNFELEVDIAGEVMSEVGFRVKDLNNYESVYSRNFNGGKNTALQYVPIYNGTINWKFFNYPGYEATADIASNVWFKLKVIVKGGMVQVYINDIEQANMQVRLIRNDLGTGKILLKTGFGVSYFANLEVKELPDVGTDNTSENEGTDYITNWLISDTISNNNPFCMNQYENLIESVSHWREIDDKSTPYVILSKYFNHPQGVVFAKHQISVEKETYKFLDFNFTGDLRVFLNNQEVFHYHQLDFARVFPGEHSIALRLKQGENKLVFISEGDGYFFGDGYNSLGRKQHQNWGFIAKLTDYEFE